MIVTVSVLYDVIQYGVCYNELFLYGRFTEKASEYSYSFC